MLALHAAWLLNANDTHARLALWGETNTLPQTRRGRDLRAKPNTLPHPFYASVESLSRALPLPELNACATAVQAVARLPSTDGEPQPSRPFLRYRVEGQTETRRRVPFWLRQSDFLAQMSRAYAAITREALALALGEQHAV
jgi:hypothetical protein